MMNRIEHGELGPDEQEAVVHRISRYKDGTTARGRTLFWSPTPVPAEQAIKAIHRGGLPGIQETWPVLYQMTWRGEDGRPETTGYKR
jgi:hypothetical protein